MKARLPEGFGGGGGQNNLMKQAQKMQENMATLQDELDAREYTATAGGNMVEVTITGKHEVKAIKIKPEVVDPDDVEMLEDLLIAAVNEAVRNASDNASEEMGKITGGLNIPGLF